MSDVQAHAPGSAHGNGHDHGLDPGQHDAALHAHGDTHGHGSMRSYITGFVLSAVLTVIPFWLVMTGALESTNATAIIIIVMALAQIVVHTICFLHVNTQAEGGWTLMAYAFTAVLVLITIGGSLWIMFHLNTNMMPSMPTGTTTLTP
jgi:cytochrome o ubiquinol oxidase operon protein cyoD